MNTLQAFLAWFIFPFYWWTYHLYYNELGKTSVIRVMHFSLLRVLFTCYVLLNTSNSPVSSYSYIYIYSTGENWNPVLLHDAATVKELLTGYLILCVLVSKYSTVGLYGASFLSYLLLFFWTSSYCVVQVGLKLNNPPARSWVLGLQVSSSRPKLLLL